MGAARTKMLVETLFCGRFQPFCSFQTVFSDMQLKLEKTFKVAKETVFSVFLMFFGENSQKTSENQQKRFKTGKKSIYTKHLSLLIIY